MLDLHVHDLFHYLHVYFSAKKACNSHGCLDNDQMYSISKVSQTLTAVR